MSGVDNQEGVGGQINMKEGDVSSFSKSETKNYKAWGLAIIAAVLFVMLIMYQYRGINVLIMTVLMVYITFDYKKAAGMPIKFKFYAMSTYMILISFVFLLTTVGLIRFFAGMILLSMTIALFYSESSFTWPSWLVKGFVYVANGLGGFGAFFTIGRLPKNSKNKQFLQVIVGVIIAVPLLLIALGLLSSSDAIFGDMVEEFINNISETFDIFEALKFERVFSRGIMFLLIAPTLYGLSRYLVIVRRAQVDGRQDGQESLGGKGGAKLKIIPPTISATILVLLNLLYLVFAYVQIRFLFFGDINTDTYNYASYAREGFFELLGLSILNTIGILFINTFTKEHAFNKVALSITAACTHIMIASSTYKMYLYESEYGYTQLRLYVYFILAYMVVFMTLITVNIWKTSYPVIEWAMIIGLCYFLVIGMVNVDDVIVKRNISRYETVGDLDVSYLTSLSDDAMPRLIEFMNGHKEEQWEWYDIQHYNERLSKIEADHELRKVFEYNVRHQKAYKWSKKALRYDH